MERLEVRQVGLPEDMQVVLTEHLVKCMLIILQHKKNGIQSLLLQRSLASEAEAGVQALFKFLDVYL